MVEENQHSPGNYYHHFTAIITKQVRLFPRHKNLQSLCTMAI